MLDTPIKRLLIVLSIPTLLTCAGLFFRFVLHFSTDISVAFALALPLLIFVLFFVLSLIVELVCWILNG